MFAKNITNNLFLTLDMDRYFSNIPDCQFLGERSLASTLRALLHNRIGESRMRAACRSTRTDVERIKRSGVCEFIERLAINEREIDLEIVALNGSDNNDNDSALCKFDSERDGLTASFENYKEISILKEFSKQFANLNARFYVNDNERKTLIFASNLDIRKFHFIQSLIPRFIPWFFAENPLTEKEKELLIALTSRSCVDYERLINEIGGSVDYRSKIIREKIGDIVQTSRASEIVRTERDIRIIHERMDDLMSEYERYIANLDSLNIRMNGLKEAIAKGSDESDLIDYFVCNKDLILLDASDHKISFVVRTYLECFDPEMCEAYINNNYSEFYADYDRHAPFSSKESRKKMFEAIFSDNPVFKVRMCANYTIDLRGSVKSVKYYDYGPECMGYIPNPHIHYFECIGNYLRYINKLIRDGDIVMAVEQCVASAKSLNVSEGVTFRQFARDLFSSDSPVIELQDGTLMTAVEGLRYLEDIEKNSKEEHNGEADRSE